MKSNTHLQISGFVSYRKMRNVQGYVAKLNIITHTSTGLIKHGFEFKHTSPLMCECLAVNTFEHFAKLFKDNYTDERFTEAHITKLPYRSEKLTSQLICWNLI